MVTAMATELATGAVDDVSLAFREVPVPSQEVSLALAGEEAEVLLSGLRATVREWRAAISRTSGLVSSVSGKRTRSRIAGGNAASM